MELRQLRYFVAVAEELHFRRAAVRLHMSQPPLSHQIRLLEEELGFRLLIRTRRQVALTPAGALFLQDARAILEDLEGAIATARRISAGQAGRLRINFSGSALLSILPRLVRLFRSDRPDVELELRERSTAAQIGAIQTGSVDIGLVPLPVDASGIKQELLLREPTVAALPAGHPLAKLQRVPLRRLAAEPLVLFPRDQAPGLHDELLARLNATGTSPIIAQYAPETHTIIGLVAAGIGVSLVQTSVQGLALPGVTYRPVTNAPVIELAAITSPTERSLLAEAFLALARSELRPPRERS